MEFPIQAGGEMGSGNALFNLCNHSTWDANSLQPFNDELPAYCIKGFLEVYFQCAPKKPLIEMVIM